MEEMEKTKAQMEKEKEVQRKLKEDNDLALQSEQAKRGQLESQLKQKYDAKLAELNNKQEMIEKLEKENRNLENM